MDAQSMDEIVYRRAPGALPFVTRRDDALFLTFGAGADANHELRTFQLPISDAHLHVIQTDFARHLILWSALQSLADDAGTQNPLDEAAAFALLDSILLGSEAEIEELFKNSKWHKDTLIAHHADPALLALGKIFDAAQSLTPEADFKLAQEYEASRRHLFIDPLDEAVLRYTNKYLHGGGLPSRNPNAVNPELLPSVLEIVSHAEQACAGMELPLDYGTDYARFHERDKQAWHAISQVVERALHAAYPTLSSASVAALSFLMCSEAASRAKEARKNAS
jgi:hypothetical protein